MNVRLDRRRSAALRAALAAPLCAALLACLSPTPAVAAPELHWSVAHIPGAPAFSGVSCASATLCVAVDRTGHVWISTSPSSSAAGAWTAKQVDEGRALSSISCVAGPLCVAVDGEGHALTSTDPAAGAGSTWSPVPIDGTTTLTGVSCASSSSCVAVDEHGEAIVATNPAAGSWLAAATIDGGHVLKSVSCTTAGMCVAVDDAGRALTSANPASGVWEVRTIDSNPLALSLTSIACAPLPANACVGVNSGGEAFASGNPGAGLPAASTATWSATPIAADALTGVSCQAAGLCVAVDGGGYAYTSDTAAAATPTWSTADIDSPDHLSGVSCVAEGLCTAVDEAGQALVTRVPPPILATSSPSPVNVAETAATLTGTVDTNDAVLSSCRFEYGTSEAYGQSVPCGAGGALSLAAGSASQPVSATASGLAPNVTYDYRLVAASASGEAVTANATFKTPSPPLVQPHPSIAGIPAPGQRLTCKAGVSGSGASSATLSYAWLRDTRGIAGASGSSYVVGGADVSHHLQCRVTATNAGGSASATSAFVTVPAGGLGAISETQVGAPRVAGRTVSVPVACSAQAAGSCTITLRLTVAETLRGGRVVAVAARRASPDGGIAARRTTHRMVTVGSVTARVPDGQRRTVTVVLNKTGRSLLARGHRLTARLSVSGTVVGALSAQLRSATVTFGGASKASSRKASARRRR